MAIEWKPVVGFESRYQVSNNGAVVSLPREVMRRNGMRYTAGAKPLKYSIRPSGHLTVKLYGEVGTKPTTLSVHRLVLQAFVGPAPEGLVCRHINGNPTDNRVENLAWGTYQENADDREDHGTHAKGSECVRAKLTEEQIPKIRFLVSHYRRHGILTAVAELFGVAAAVPHQIDRRELWSHVPESMWEDPREIIGHCTICRSDQTQLKFKCSERDYDFYECQGCKGYRFRIDDVHVAPLRDKKKTTRKLETYQRGSARSQSKITEDDVREIRRLRKSGVTGREVARQFGVTEASICDIIKQRTWKHVE